ncbi:hypothetical protein BT63DRAFT_475878 [Microthyrium microscopicum]|uniref:Uncharacterized protein n=1 Tax=Microthyrium microscopicum TaxID=703497 RepID=A0A6A6UM70_9PEZI|nr:hypothetical protein BT63DRAFT_475878 [Microthyrium microscopicum]
MTKASNTARYPYDPSPRCPFKMVLLPLFWASVLLHSVWKTFPYVRNTVQFADNCKRLVDNYAEIHTSLEKLQTAHTELRNLHAELSADLIKNFNITLHQEAAGGKSIKTKAPQEVPNDKFSPELIHDCVPGAVVKLALERSGCPDGTKTCLCSNEEFWGWLFLTSKMLCNSEEQNSIASAPEQTCGWVDYVKGWRERSTTGT